MDDTAVAFLLGILFAGLAAIAIGASHSSNTDKNVFIQRCSSDNGVAIFADHEYCIKRSAFVETVR